MTDEAFDNLLPPWARTLSVTHWTPAAVARRAAQWMVVRPGAPILDVGSGVGKFCILGALSTVGCFTGVEQRPRLVELARQLVDRAAVPRCRFIQADAAEVEWGAYEGIYLYNPFAERILNDSRQDDDIAYAPDEFRRYVLWVEQAIAALPSHARVVTYHGFGGRMPRGWRRERVSAYGPNKLELWTKTARARQRRPAAGAAG